LQKVVLDELPIAFMTQNSLLAAENSKVKGVDIINAPFGPQINRVYMVKEYVTELPALEWDPCRA
jgi:hypothetical protein